MMAEYGQRILTIRLFFALIMINFQCIDKSTSQAVVCPGMGNNSIHCLLTPGLTQFPLDLPKVSINPLLVGENVKTGI